MKKTLQNIVTWTAVGFGAMALSARVSAADPEGTINTDFKTVVEMQNPGSSYKTLENSKEVPRNQLKYRANPDDPTGASDQNVTSEGIWDVGFFKYVSGGIRFGAYANDNNVWSNYLPERAGWLQGKMYINTFNYEERPDDLIIVHDRTGDGSVKLVPNGTNSYTLYVAPNPADKAYYYKDIILNGRRGDTSGLPAFNHTPTEILPPIVISPYNEIPAENRGAKTTYYQGIRKGSAGSLDMIAMAENWMQSCGPHNYWCDGADWDTNGTVNLDDFNEMSTRYVGSEMGPRDLVNIAENWLRDDCRSENKWCNNSDLSRDGVVNYIDVSRLSENYDSDAVDYLNQ